MLNYIWAGLLAISFLFAATWDIRDLVEDTYRNGQPLPVTVRFDHPYDRTERSRPVQVEINAATFRAFYAAEESPASSYKGILIQTEEGTQLRFAKDADVPYPLTVIRSITSARDNDLRGPLSSLRLSGDSTATASVLFAPVRFVKMQAIAESAISMARTAVTLAFGLIGILALWMGLLQIAEKSGLVHALVRITQPVLRPLFPEIPKDHPALGLIVLNLTANMLGLGNAATPLGIKAMEELQTLNSTDDTATNSMVMLLAMNTASVQLVPPVLLVALMGLQINQLIFAIIIVTGISLIVAILSARLLGKLSQYRASDPARIERVTDATPLAGTDA